MKNPVLGDYFLYEGKPARILCEANERTVIVEMLENKCCPHCNGDLGKEHFSIIPTSPLFQENAEPMQTFKP